MTISWRVGAVTFLALTAMSAQQAPRFTVASVKRAAGTEPKGPHLSPGRLTFESTSVWHLITFAYRAHDYQIEGAPDWVRTEAFTIDAKAEGDVSPGAMLPLVQTLLEDRFALKTHRETVEGPVYLLTVAKGGIKMKEAPAGSCVDMDEVSVTQLRDRAKAVPMCDIRGGGGGPERKPVATGIRMGGARAPDQATTTFVGYLSGILDRPVIDRTGLTAKYNFQLDFVMDGAAPTSELLGAPLADALREQLGLRLETGKGPVERLVIDHVERPAEN